MVFNGSNPEGDEVQKGKGLRLGTIEHKKIEIGVHIPFFYYAYYVRNNAR